MDEQARKQTFEQLLDLHQNKVFRLAIYYLKDPHKAEEITQEIFVKLWRTLPALDDRATPSTWLYTVTRNTCLTALRADGYRRTVPVDAIPEPSAPGNNTLSKLAINQCVDRLPDAQRAVITLFYLQEESLADVAQVLNLPVGTVKSHLHRARQALATMFKE